MSDDTTYNGWHNYETWAVGMYLDGNYTGKGTYRYVVELVRGQLSFQHLEGDGVERRRVADTLQEFVKSHLFDDDASGDPPMHPLAADLLGAAVDNVDWYELADAWITNVREQVTS